MQLWTDGEVMKYVGFPNGDDTNPKRIEAYLNKQADGYFDRVLLACLSDGTAIGECKLCPPDEKNLAHTDIKLHPNHWGSRYGIEIKQALIDYLFTHTGCDGVFASPNQSNIASIKMQEAVGAKKVAEGIYQFPESMKEWTCDVPYYEYVVDRATWETKRSQIDRG